MCSQGHIFFRLFGIRARGISISKGNSVCDCHTGDHTVPYNLIRVEYEERIGQYLQDNGVSRATLHSVCTVDLVKRDWHVFLTTRWTTNRCTERSTLNITK